MRTLASQGAPVALALVLCVQVWGAPLGEVSLWGANWGGYLCCYRLTVYEIDVATGTVRGGIQIPGDQSRAGVRDFASDPVRHRSHIWSLHHSERDGYQLLSFDPHRPHLLAKVDLDDSLALQGLAIDPTTGVFYATSATALYSIDPSSGATSLIGPTPLRVDGALGFDLSGNLFGVGGPAASTARALILVDKLTGATTKVADMDASPADITVHPQTGVMYGLGFGKDPARDYSLYQIDLTNGAISDIGPSVFRPAGLAFTIIPEPAGAVLALFGAAAVLAARVRRSNAPCCVMR